MKIVSIVGARPQFIKAAAVSRLLRAKHDEVLVHTGQHYDQNMSQLFFDELDIPAPDINLDVGSSSHAVQTADMITGIERVLEEQRPTCVLVYGDTNSTLAGALVASKMRVPVAHVEAGLRSFNRAMPEEINRIVADHVSTLLLCPSDTAVSNLAAEGITSGVHMIGDVMADALAYARRQTRTRDSLLDELRIEKKGYALATVHRQENTDDTERLSGILDALNALTCPLIFPVHPRTRKKLDDLGYVPAQHVHLVDPIGYLDMVHLAENAKMVMTDSGGLQKEVYWLGVPCITLRDETEWVETVEAGWNHVVGAKTQSILDAVQQLTTPDAHPALYGDGQAAPRLVQLMESEIA